MPDHQRTVSEHARTEVQRMLANLHDRGFAPAWVAARLKTWTAEVSAWNRGERSPAPGQLARLRRLVRSARHG
jgi:hypothetical protein